MVTIKLAKPWTFRNPETTIDYPAGTQEVFKYIADQAAAEGAIEETTDGGTSQPRKGNGKGAADAGEK